MSALVMTAEMVKRCVDLAAWAERPEHWYRPAAGAAPPGDNPAHVVHIDHGFRAVFSITVHNGRRFRHLSISVPGPKFPHPYCAWAVAVWFGFTGGKLEHNAIEPGPDWLMDASKAENCIVIAQDIGPE